MNSSRDYQTLLALGNPLELLSSTAGIGKVAVSYELNDGAGEIGGVGGYIHASKDTTVRFRVLVESSREVLSQSIVLSSNYHWTRFGGTWAISEDKPTYLIVEMTWTLHKPILIWGLSCGRVALPTAIAKQFSSNPNLTGILQSPSICPECLYLPHDSPLCGGTLLGSGNVEVRECARPNPGKKCSQCQRVLPIDPRLAAYRKTQDACKRAPRNMVVAFHGHRSKRTGYQNECRSCKNVEINGHFNVIRTADQFHESSTLTRERKLLLRESEVLKEFKQRRSKEGLRSFVWHRFDHKCFRCGNAVGLQEFELDHTRPLAYLWPLDEHATCLCGPCNNAKKDAFPADYYSPREITRLAAIVGLSEASLKTRGVNQAELRRIRLDIVRFAESWDPRLFNSVADRVREFHPDIDLFAELQAASLGAHRKLVRSLVTRPASILEVED